jgi:hypothetical protein
MEQHFNTRQRIRARFLRTCLALSGSALLLGACASTETPSEQAPRTASGRISSEITASAEVVSVDARTRGIVLRRQDGSTFKVQAGDEVRNFAQIRSGDMLRVRYAETLDARLLPAGSSLEPAEAAVAAGRAEAGAKPGGIAAAGVSFRARVESIDRERSIIVCSLFSGERLERYVGTAEGRAFIAKLKVGDVVQFEYAEALAVSVDSL